MKNIFITGGTGFIGKHVVSDLIDQNYNVSASVRKYDPTLPACVKQIIIENYLDLPRWDGNFKDIDTVIHMAAQTKVAKKQSLENKEQLENINIHFTKYLASLASQADVKRFIFLSSIKVNGEISNVPFSENDKPNPEDDYGLSKLEAEQALSTVAMETGLEVVIIRPPIVYGRGVKGSFHSLVKIASTGIPLPLANIQNKRSLCSVKNLSNFITTIAINHPLAANEVFCIADNESLSISELVSLISSIAGKNTRHIPIPKEIFIFLLGIMGQSKISDSLFGSLEINITKAEKILGWKPSVKIDDELRKILHKK